MGLLGAQVQRDPQSKFFKITKIFKGQNWDPSLRSPLTEIGVDAKAGDYIVEVDGQSTAGLTDIWEALVGKAGKQVSLTLNATPSAQGARETVVVPVEDERGLYYFDMGAGQHREGHQGHQRPRRLHPHPRHGRARPERVREVLLSPDREGSDDRRRPQQRRRQRVADDHRTAAARARAGRHRPQRRAEREPRRDDPRAEGAAGRRVLGVGRRPGHLPLQGLQDGPGHRQAHVGRRRRHPRHAAAARRRRS